MKSDGFPLSGVLSNRFVSSSSSSYLPTALKANCWYKNKQYDCGVTFNCRIQSKVVVEGLCGANGPGWQCCVPKDVANDNKPSFSTNDASK